MFLGPRFSGLRKPNPVFGTQTLFSRLQFALEFVEEAPIGILGDDLLRTRLDEARIVQTQGIKPDRVLGVLLPPFVVRQLGQRLTCVFVLVDETAIDNGLRDPRRLGSAEVGRLEDGA